MKRCPKLYIYLSTLLACFSLSCASDLDFNQVDNLKLEPVFVANFANFEISVENFFINGAQQTFISGPTGFDAFSNTFYRDNLKKAIFSFEINSTIPRSVSVSAELLDDKNKLLLSIPITIPEYTGSPVKVSQSKVFENTDKQLLLNTKKTQFVVKLNPGTAIANTGVSSLKFRSSATIYLEIK